MYVHFRPWRQGHILGARVLRGGQCCLTGISSIVLCFLKLPLYNYIAISHPLPLWCGLVVLRTVVRFGDSASPH